MRSQGSIRPCAQAPLSRHRLQKSFHAKSSVLVQRAMLSAIEPRANLRFRKLLRTRVIKKRCSAPAPGESYKFLTVCRS